MYYDLNQGAGFKPPIGLHHKLSMKGFFRFRNFLHSLILSIKCHLITIVLAYWPDTTNAM